MLYRKLAYRAFFMQTNYINITEILLNRNILFKRINNKGAFNGTINRYNQILG